MSFSTEAFSRDWTLWIQICFKKNVEKLIPKKE